MGTPLGAASTTGQAEIVELLLRNGVKFHCELGDTGYSTSLQAASCHGGEEVVKLLLKAGSNVNAHGNGSFDTAL